MNIISITEAFLREQFATEISDNLNKLGLELKDIDIGVSFVIANSKEIHVFAIVVPEVAEDGTKIALLVAENKDRDLVKFAFTRHLKRSVIPYLKENYDFIAMEVKDLQASEWAERALSLDWIRSDFGKETKYL